MEIKLYHIVRKSKDYRKLLLFCFFFLLRLFIVEPLDESQSELQFVQATITSFSFYAVIFRLKSHTFQFDESVKSPEFTCQVIEYPGTSVTIPTRSMSKGMAMTIKVREYY